MLDACPVPFLALGAEHDASFVSVSSRSRACWFARQIPAVCSLPIRRALSINRAEVEKVSEDLPAVMCSLCQYAGAVGETERPIAKNH